MEPFWWGIAIGLLIVVAIFGLWAVLVRRFGPERIIPRHVKSDKKLGDG
jgi:hypothetical protein